MKLNDMLAYKVAMLSNDLSQSLASIYRPFGLSMPEWRVVATLGNNNAMSVSYTHLTLPTSDLV